MAIPSASICASLRVLDMPEHEVVPGSLRRWFVFHGVVDALFAVPLFLAPGTTLSALGVPGGDPLLGRMVAAALVAIGGHSLRMRRADVSAYRAMLDLKLLWSGAAMAALLFGGSMSGPLRAVFLLFFVFFCVWARFRFRAPFRR